MTVSEPSLAPNRRLDTWKEIGAFFGRDERTVKRWETTRGLPVHRVPGAGRANVYAYTEELAEWLSGARIAAERDADASSDLPNGIAAEPEIEKSAQTGNEPSPPNSNDIYGDAGFVDRRVGERRSTESVARNSSFWQRRPAGRYAAVITAMIVVALVLVALVRRASSAGAVGARAAVARHHAPDPEAEQLYLKGIYYWQRRTPETLHQAVDYFTQAVVRDPQYAEAYVGLADCYNLLREYSEMPPTEAYPRALAAAQRAVALDDSLSGAHSSLGFVDFYWSWDVAGAQREFVRALTLDPNSVIAHHWYGTYLLHLGRFTEALQEIETAQRLDPNSSPILADKGLVLFYAGQQEQAVELLKQLSATEPEFLSPHSYLAFIHLAQGHYPQYLAEFRKTATLRHDETQLAIVAAGEKGLARAGARGMWSDMLKVQQALYADGREPAYDMARTCALLGRKNDALKNLQNSYEKRETDLLKLRIDPTLGGLRDEPRFREIVAQIGLPPLP